MLKSLLCLLLFAIVSIGAAFSQSRTVGLGDQSIKDMSREFYIAEVLDSRIVKTSIGTVQLGMLNRKAPAQFPQPLEQELLGFISKHLPQQPNQVPVILRVNKFWISEETKASTETGSADILVDFLLQEGDSYRKLYTAAAVASERGMDVTKKHEANIARVIADCLSQFSNRSITELLAQAETLTPDQAHATFDKVILVPEFPILQAQAYSEGIYKTLDEFRTNNPTAAPGFEVRGRSSFQNAMVGGGDIMPYQTTAEGKQKPVKDAWGFSDGHTLYIRYQNAYYPLALRQNTFIFMGPPEMNTNVAATGAVVTAAVLGGPIGGAIAGGIRAATAKPAEYTLDLMTGHLTIDGKIVGANPAGAKLLIYREAKPELPQTITITVNGETRAIGPNEMLEYALPNVREGAAIRFPGDDASCVKFMPEPGNTYYLACSLSKKSANGQPVVELVDKAAGEYALRGIKFSREKEEKRKSKKSR